jgi:hypothetical protein
MHRGEAVSFPASEIQCYPSTHPDALARQRCCRVGERVLYDDEYASVLRHLGLIDDLIPPMIATIKGERIL